ncbi:hypothetical protein HanIR_Chr02g0063071 [Helianthus annuus]|nr:hypothetical protein HanIR_Chr02g0063071 [Helianthus annuus]
MVSHCEVILNKAHRFPRMQIQKYPSRALRMRISQSGLGVTESRLDQVIVIAHPPHPLLLDQWQQECQKQIRLLPKQLYKSLHGHVEPHRWQSQFHTRNMKPVSRSPQQPWMTYGSHAHPYHEPSSSTELSWGGLIKALY